MLAEAPCTQKPRGRMLRLSSSASAPSAANSAANSSLLRDHAPELGNGMSSSAGGCSGNAPTSATVALEAGAKCEMGK